MSILQVFFWFCKREKIMDVIFNRFHKEPITTYVYISDINAYGYKYVSLQEFLEYTLVNRIPLSICDVLFRFIKDKDKKNKITRKWKYFAENNVIFKDEYIKKDDWLEIIYSGQRVFQGQVFYVEPGFNGEIHIKTDNGTRHISLFTYLKNYDILINGEKKTPQFYIKRKRKKYL